eukprot:scaffold1561_cov404-Prasinococcus_capsulatus_cf.AAC.6
MARPGARILLSFELQVQVRAAVPNHIDCLSVANLNTMRVQGYRASQLGRGYSSGQDVRQHASHALEKAVFASNRYDQVSR